MHLDDLPPVCQAARTVLDQHVGRDQPPAQLEEQPRLMHTEIMYRRSHSGHRFLCRFFGELEENFFQRTALRPQVPHLLIGRRRHFPKHLRRLTVGQLHDP